ATGQGARGRLAGGRPALPRERHAPPGAPQPRGRPRPPLLVRRRIHGRRGPLDGDRARRPGAPRVPAHGGKPPRRRCACRVAAPERHAPSGAAAGCGPDDRAMTPHGRRRVAAGVALLVGAAVVWVRLRSREFSLPARIVTEDVIADLSAAFDRDNVAAEAPDALVRQGVVQPGEPLRGAGARRAIVAPPGARIRFRATLPAGAGPRPGRRTSSCCWSTRCVRTPSAPTVPNRAGRLRSTAWRPKGWCSSTPSRSRAGLSRRWPRSSAACIRAATGR